MTYYKISFRKFKKNCSHRHEHLGYYSDECKHKEGARQVHFTDVTCTEKLCPVLKTCEKGDGE